MSELEEMKRTCDEKHSADRGRIEKLENTVVRIFEILDKYKQRPTWLVAGIITFLASGLAITLTELIHQVVRTGPK